MSYKRKTYDEYTLQGDYGQGWEDLTSDTSWKGIIASRNDYRENEGGCYRIITKRVKIEAEALV